MKKIERLLVPSHTDWVCAAQLIRRYSDRHGDLKPRDHYADALIVVSASNKEATVQTYNLDDFERWVELARAAGRKVTAVKYEP